MSWCIPQDLLNIVEFAEFASNAVLLDGGLRQHGVDVGQHTLDLVAALGHWRKRAFVAVPNMVTHILFNTEPPRATELMPDAA